MAPLSIDLKTTGAWVAWERQWSEPLTRVEATFIGDDGSSLDRVEVGSGTQVRRDRATRDSVEVTTAFTPSAQILQPLAFTGATARIPGGWRRPLIVHSVPHALSATAAATTTLRARPTTEP